MVKATIPRHIGHYVMDIFRILENVKGFPTFNLSDDFFIHFTPLSRAKEILHSGHLLSNPPYKKFGISGIQAVSAIYGTFLPGVQTTHIKSDEEIVAVVFKTNIPPDIGHAEEVIWQEHVDKLPLLDAKIITKQEAIKILQKGKKVDTFFYANK